MIEELDELGELERELKRLRPRGVDAALLGRVAAALDEPAEPVWDRWVRWALPAAAGLVLGLVAVQFREPLATAPGMETQARTAGEALPPIAAEKLVLDAADDGLLTLADGTPVRRLWSRSLETVTWRDPLTNASLQWSVPRERIRLLPVVAQ